MKKKKNCAALDALKAVKKKNREEEIKLHGKLISMRPTRIAESKKIYNRKRDGKKNPDYYNSSDFFIVESYYSIYRRFRKQAQLMQHSN